MENMNTTPTYKGKGVIRDTNANHVEQGFGAFDREPLKQDPPATVPPKNASVRAAPLEVAPLTIAMPDEPVVCTPRPIVNHKAYNGGWKVLRNFRKDGSGRAYLTFIHKDYGRRRSIKQVLNKLDSLLLKEKEKESADQGEHRRGVSQQAQGMSAASACPIG